MYNIYVYIFQYLARQSSYSDVDISVDISDKTYKVQKSSQLTSYLSLNLKTAPC